MTKDKKVVYYKSLAESFLQAVKRYESEKKWCEKEKEKVREWYKPIELREHEGICETKHEYFETMEELHNYLQERVSKKEEK